MQGGIMVRNFGGSRGEPTPERGPDVGAAIWLANQSEKRMKLVLIDLTIPPKAIVRMTTFKAPLILFLLGRVLRQRQPFDYGLIFVLLSASPVNRFKLASSSITTN
jgi:hypothetical protein